MDQLHDHCSLADRGGAALRRPCANVPSRVDPRHAGLEQVVAGDGGAGEDEAVLVALDRIVLPLCAGPRTEKEKQERERQALSARQRHRVESAAVPV